MQNPNDVERSELFFETVKYLSPNVMYMGRVFAPHVEKSELKRSLHIEILVKLKLLFF